MEKINFEVIGLKESLQKQKELQKYFCNYCKQSYILESQVQNGICIYCQEKIEHKKKLFLKKIPEHYHNARDFFKKDECNLNNYFISGTTGNGKTTLAYATILYNQKELQNSFIIENTTNFLRKSLDDEEFDLQKYKKIKLLILDDFHNQNFSEYSQRFILDLLNYRYYTKDLFTFLLSEISLRDLKINKNLYDSLCGRIVENSILLEIKRENFRLKNIKKKKII